MALEVKHKFQSQQPNGTDESVIRPVNWNDDHNLIMAGPALLGKSSLGNGPVTEITLSNDFEFDGNQLKLAQPTLPGGTSYTDEQAQDAAAAAIAAGTHDGVQVTYNDAANFLSFVNTDKGTTARAAHEAVIDPHPQYVTAVEAAIIAENAVSQHSSASDPHPGYMTQTEADERYQLAGSGGGNFVELTRAAYNALAVKNPQTWYVIIPG